MMYEVRREPPLKLPATSPLWWSIPGAYLRKLLKPESWGCVQTARSRAFGTRSAVMGRKQSHWRHQSSSYTGQGPLKESKRVCRDKQQGDRTKHQYLHFHCKAKAWLVRLGAESRLLSWAKGWHQPTLQTDLWLQCSSTAWQQRDQPLPALQWTSSPENLWSLSSLGYFTLWCDSR